MKLTAFVNDALGFDSFEGYTRGENWNGWSCPYFTFEQAQNVLKIYNEVQTITANNLPGRYDAQADVFVFSTEPEGETEIYSAIVENNEKYYGIGAFNWIWEEAKDNIQVLI